MTDFVTLPLLNPRGVYDPTIWYDPNDQITYNGVPYFCRVGIINGQPITPGSDPTVWQLLQEPGTPGDKGDKGDPGVQGPQGRDGVPGASGAGYRVRGQWTAADTYSAGDSVSYKNSSQTYTVMWFAIKDNTNVVPGSDNTVWGAGIKGDTGDVTPAAQAAAAAALASQNAAAASQAAAAGSATAASGSASAASASQTAASGSATAAAGSATAASGSASSASTSAGTATTQAGIATTQAGNASASASTATAQAGIATTQAGNASTSAVQSAASAAAAATSAASVGPGNPNLVFNGSAEAGTLGWSGGGPAMGTARDGDGAYFVAGANGSSATGTYQSQAFPVWGGNAHTVQGDLSVDGAATGTYYLDVQYYTSSDGSGAVLYDGGNAVLATLGSFVGVKTTDTAALIPAGARSARVRVVYQGATWNSLKWRRVKVEKSVSASPYSDEATMLAFSPNPPANLSPIFQAVQVLGKLYGVNSPNLLVNGSGELGTAAWGTILFAPVTGSLGEGTFYQNQTAISASTEDISQNIVITNGVAVALSYEANTAINGGVTSGTAHVWVEAFTSANASLGSVCDAVATNGVGWSQYRAFGTTPANTAYVKVHKALGGTSPTAAAFGLNFRRIKFETGTSCSLYSTEASLAYLQGAPALSGRPTFAGKTPWDSGNLPVPVASSNNAVTVTWSGSTGLGLKIDATTIGNLIDSAIPQTIAAAKTFTAANNRYTIASGTASGSGLQVYTSGNLASMGFTCGSGAGAGSIFYQQTGFNFALVNSDNSAYAPLTVSTLTQASDVLLKKNIADYGPVLPRLIGKRAVSYILKQDPTQTVQVGAIAQEWQRDFPELVIETSTDIDEDGDFIAHQYDEETGEEIFGPNGKPESRRALGFNYANASVVALQGVVELQQALTEALGRIKTLEDQLSGK